MDNIAVSVIYYALCMLGMWKLFEKAGHHGWEALIPFYNLYVLFEISWGNGFYFVFCLIPIANIVMAAITCWKLAKSFDAGPLMALGLFFVTPLFMIWMGFADFVYQGPSYFNFHRSR